MTKTFVDPQFFARQAPIGRTTRVSRDGVWPLRDAQGRTWAERKAQEAAR